MNILLHICCAPCLIFPFSRLIDQGFKIQGFYYNPNIFPFEEFNQRKTALENLSQDLGLSVEYPLDQQSDFAAINQDENNVNRCVNCWSLRLRKTAWQAKQYGIPAFSTTLLVSPYQNHQLLKQTAQAIAQEEGIDFYYEDFRSGFKQAQEQARIKGIYRQKYCGCKFSMKPKIKDQSA